MRSQGWRGGRVREVAGEFNPSPLRAEISSLAFYCRFSANAFGRINWFGRGKEDEGGNPENVLFERRDVE